MLINVCTVRSSSCDVFSRQCIHISTSPHLLGSLTFILTRLFPSLHDAKPSGVGQKDEGQGEGRQEGGGRGQVRERERVCKREEGVGIGQPPGEGQREDWQGEGNLLIKIRGKIGREGMGQKKEGQGEGSPIGSCESITADQALITYQIFWTLFLLHLN